tara:strand:+ start:981 stop:1895 length:915 start_codon:yes stop_codon:yes gene_type:complete
MLVLNTSQRRYSINLKHLKRNTEGLIVTTNPKTLDEFEKTWNNETNDYDTLEPSATLELFKNNINDFALSFYFSKALPLRTFLELNHFAQNHRIIICNSTFCQHIFSIKQIMDKLEEWHHHHQMLDKYQNSLDSYHYDLLFCAFLGALVSVTISLVARGDIGLITLACFIDSYCILAYFSIAKECFSLNRAMSNYYNTIPLNPKEKPLLDQLMKLRQDCFQSVTSEEFQAHVLDACFEILNQKRVPTSVIKSLEAIIKNWLDRPQQFISDQTIERINQFLRLNPSSEIYQVLYNFSNYAIHSQL